MKEVGCVGELFENAVRTSTIGAHTRRDDYVTNRTWSFFESQRAVSEAGHIREQHAW